MTTVTIQPAGGEALELNVKNADTLALAMTRQEPAHAVICEDDSILYVNFRNVVALAIEPEEGEDVGSDTEQAEDTRTVAELKSALDAASVDYPSDARKADLQDLAKTNNL